MEKRDSKIFSLAMTKALTVALALIIILAIAGFAESILSGRLLWAVISALIIWGSIRMIARLSKSRNFKTINRLEGPSSLGEEMK